jgi:hypothetical protein
MTWQPDLLKSSCHPRLLAFRKYQSGVRRLISDMEVLRITKTEIYHQEPSAACGSATEQELASWITVVHKRN